MCTILCGTMQDTPSKALQGLQLAIVWVTMRSAQMVLACTVCMIAMITGELPCIRGSAPTPRSSTSDMPDRASFRAVLGSFIVEWTADRLTFSALLSPPALSHTPARSLVWSSVPGQPFLRVASVNFSAPEYQGVFFVSTDQRWSSETLSVDYWRQPSDNSVLIAGQLGVGGAMFNYSLLLSETGAGTLHFNASVAIAGRPTPTLLSQPNCLSLVFASEPTEAIFGMGSSYTDLNLKGRAVPVITSEQGVGRGLQPVTLALNTFEHGAGGNWHTTYTPIPHYVSSRNVSFYLTNSEYSVFNFTEADATAVSVMDLLPAAGHISAAGAVLAASSPLDLIELYANYSGRMPPLPEWMAANGAIVGMEGGTASIRTKVAQLQAAQVPVAGLWVQDWTGVRQDSFGKRLLWNWEVDEQ